MKDVKAFQTKKERKEKKGKKRQYGRKRYKNLQQDKKQKHIEYINKYCKMRKNVLI